MSIEREIVNKLYESKINESSVKRMEFATEEEAKEWAKDFGYIITKVQFSKSANSNSCICWVKKATSESVELDIEEDPTPTDDETIIRSEHHPINTGDKPNITEDVTIDIDKNTIHYDNIVAVSRSVMTSYQNANRWLDSIKETILIDYNLPYFSKVVHDLAHEMPVRFDKFGDILHTINLKVPYPGTEEWFNDETSLDTVIEHIFEILNGIKYNLFTFKKVVEKESDTVPMSIMCDKLLEEIQRDYEYYIRIKEQIPYYENNLALWDKKAMEIYNSMKEGIIE